MQNCSAYNRKSLWRPASLRPTIGSELRTISAGTTGPHRINRLARQSGVLVLLALFCLTPGFVGCKLSHWHDYRASAPPAYANETAFYSDSSSAQSASILPVSHTVRATEYTGERIEQLRAISYNCQFLPGIAKIANTRRDEDYRSRRIGSLMSNYEIVGLNEVFDKQARSQLLGELRRAWGDQFHAISSRAPRSGRVNSGLVVASRLPIIESNQLTYRHSSPIYKYGIFADRFVAKGALHARLWRGGESAEHDFLDVIVTHLEAQDTKVRHRQISELAEFIKKVCSPENPVLLLGDFNIDGSPQAWQNPESTYHAMLNVLQTARPASPFVDVWPHYAEGAGGTTEQNTLGGGKRLDYVFVSCPHRRPALLQPVNVKVNCFLDPRVEALSDHSAVVAEFHWPRSPEVQLAQQTAEANRKPLEVARRIDTAEDAPRRSPHLRATLLNQP